jgi:3-oxoacyl-[acyl-carrier protein] reductase
MGGLVSLTKSLALQLARQNIRCNIVLAGFVEDPPRVRGLKEARQRRAVEAAIPLGRIAHPREIASVALFLASEDAAYVTGAEVVVDGGLSVRPLILG